MRKLAIILMVLWHGVAFASEAELRAGLLALGEKDYSLAIEIFEPMGESGNVIAQFFLGDMYDNGVGVETDYRAAVKWYGLAARQGHVYDQVNLAELYRSQAEVQNDIYSYIWFSIAAANGVRYAKRFAEEVHWKFTADELAAAQLLAARCFNSRYKECEF